VYTITAIFSVFAYIWLLIILMFITPNKVTLMEGLITFLLFPVTVGLAYSADKNWFKEEKVSPYNTHIIGVGGQNFRAFEAAELLKGSGKDTSGASAEETAAFLTRLAMAQNKPSRAQQRINAMRQLTGGRRVLPVPGKGKAYLKEMPSLKELHETPEVNFGSGEYSVLESGGQITVHVHRMPPTGDFTVKYATEGVTATAGQDFEAVSGVLEFKDGEEEKQISIAIKDDDDVEDDETFMVKLSDPSVGKLGPFSETIVTIIDDDEPGEIGIKGKDIKLTCTEKDSHVKCIVSRFNGSSGPVKCKYATVDGSAKGGVNFDSSSGELTFENGEISKMVDIRIKNTSAYEIDAEFTVKLSDFEGPEKSKGFADHAVEFSVKIVGDEEQKKLVEEATKLMNMEVSTNGYTAHNCENRTLYNKIC